MTEMRSTGTEWWRGAAIYQIYPRSFLDTDGDGIGNIAGIVAKLDYVASLNVDGLWISPFFTSPMADFGYDVADYCDVDPLFGTLEDFDTLIARAHELGLKVIIDQVYCHTSDQHAWFGESAATADGERSDWYVWADPKPDGTPPNNWLSVFGGSAWTWNGRRKQYYLHHFLKQQPTLNLHNPKVVSALIEAGRFWIDRGVDGFRLDALNMGMSDLELRDNPAHPNSGIMGRPFDMQEHIHSLSHPNMLGVVEQMAAAFRQLGGDDFFTVAEVGGADPLQTMKAYTTGQDRLSTAYSFDFIGSPALTSELFRETIAAWPNTRDEGYPSFAFSNHDCHRVATRWALKGAPGGIAEKLFMLIQCALRGVIFVYQGEELGLPQVEIPLHQRVDPEGIANYPHDQGRDGARTPMPWDDTMRNSGFSEGVAWLPASDEHGAKSVARQDGSASSTLSFFRDALAERQAQSALRLGDLEFVETDPNVIAFRRVVDGETRSVCAVNLSAEPVSWAPPAPERTWTVALSVNLPADQLPDLLPPFSGFLAHIALA